MQIIKRNNEKEELDIMKIISVLHKANDELENKIDATTIKEIAAEIIDRIQEDDTTEEIQHLVEQSLIVHNCTDVAKAYIIKCYEKAFQRQMSDLDKDILSVLTNTNSDVALENSNKDPILVTTQRDYIAGEISKSISRRLLLDKDIVEAHDKGIIHIHKQNCGFVW